MPVLTKKQVARIDAEVERLRLGVVALDQILKKKDARIVELEAEIEELKKKLEGG